LEAEVAGETRAESKVLFQIKLKTGVKDESKSHLREQLRILKALFQLLGVPIEIH
jgi:hypothetical protein